MAYYDLYDGNDNLVASDVWIDDGSNSGTIRPTIIIIFILTRRNHERLENCCPI